MHNIKKFEKNKLNKINTINTIVKTDMPLQDVKSNNSVLNNNLVIKKNKKIIKKDKIEDKKEKNKEDNDLVEKEEDKKIVKKEENKEDKKIVKKKENKEDKKIDKKIVIKEDNDLVEKEDNNLVKKENKQEEKKVIIDVKNIDGIEYLKTINNNSIDLILTDPPYIISKVSGMDIHYNNVKNNEKNDIEFIKTDNEWEKYKKEHNVETDKNKEKYMKYGTIYGKKYCVKTNYGDWDSNFTMEILNNYISEFYNKLKKGGTMIIFFDLWKITILKEIMEKQGFKQIRFIEWIKSNPQPLNSSVNYLTNCREIALLGIKGSSPTFNSKYDKGIYTYSLQGGINRFHPTQKSLLLFEELIKKHSNEHDTILDTFLGSGTTAIACKNTQRNFKGCEISKEYYDKLILLIN
jgi:site-specific DNA-methyltransferase (adenine-specific)